MISVVSATDFQEAQRELGKYADPLSLSLAYDISLGSEAWEGFNMAWSVGGGGGGGSGATLVTCCGILILILQPAQF